jgi:hypothetical protein
MDESTIHGSCLCGTVTFEVTPPFQHFAHCHCSRCRKSSGTGHATNLIVDHNNFRWSAGEEAISRYKLPQAESFGKWFCSHCGSPLPRESRGGTIMVIPAGALDDDPQIKPSDRIFWSSRAVWSCDCHDMPTHEGYPEEWFSAPNKNNEKKK